MIDITNVVTFKKAGLGFLKLLLQQYLLQTLGSEQID